MAYTDVPDPCPTPDSVLVDVRAAGVCFPDLLLIGGQYQLKVDPPFIPGTEVAGVVRSAPEGSGLATGDRVFGPVMLGGYAEQATIPLASVMPTPPELDDGQAVSLLVNYLTMFFALQRRAALQPGETVLVLGSAGGVGTAAIQVAKAMGAHVIAVVLDAIQRRHIDTRNLREGFQNCETRAFGASRRFPLTNNFGDFANDLFALT